MALSGIKSIAIILMAGGVQIALRAAPTNVPAVPGRVAAKGYVIIRPVSSNMPVSLHSLMLTPPKDGPAEKLPSEIEAAAPRIPLRPESASQPLMARPRVRPLQPPRSTADQNSPLLSRGSQSVSGLPGPPRGEEGGAEAWGWLARSVQEAASDASAERTSLRGESFSLWPDDLGLHDGLRSKGDAAGFLDDWGGSEWFEPGAVLPKASRGAESDRRLPPPRFSWEAFGE